ncbi:MAG: riboflavin synthase [Deltaproteobacteria bacterium]|nr:MAG: riboflavin synthase [Deltaproteobacteria bacterium]
MFTGLIEDIGSVRRVERSGRDSRFVFTTTIPLADVQPGDSIAVNGACLTVTEIDGASFAALASSETLERTALGERRAGDHVHLERALRLGDRLGGHLVQGHVDGVGTLAKQEQDARAWHLWFRLPVSLLGEVVEKGSIAVDGVSLTVNAVETDRVRLTIVPFTAEKTTLTRMAVGTRVNIETDVLGKYVARQLALKGADGSLSGLLQRYGYLPSEDA